MKDKNFQVLERLETLPKIIAKHIRNLCDHSITCLSSFYKKEKKMPKSHIIAKFFRSVGKIYIWKHFPLFQIDEFTPKTCLLAFLKREHVPVVETITFFLELKQDR